MMPLKHERGVVSVNSTLEVYLVDERSYIKNFNFTQHFLICTSEFVKDLE